VSLKPVAPLEAEENAPELEEESKAHKSPEDTL